MNGLAIVTKSSLSATTHFAYNVQNETGLLMIAINKPPPRAAKVSRNKERAPQVNENPYEKAWEDAYPLVVKARKGDQAAQNEAIKILMPQIEAWARKFTHLDYDDCLEAALDGALKAINHVDLSVATDANGLAGYCHKTIRHSLIDVGRPASRRRRKVYNQLDDVDDHSFADLATIDAPVVRSDEPPLEEKREKLITYLQELGLPPKSFQLLLTVINNPTANYEDLSAAVGIVTGTVKSSLHSARTRLRNPGIMENIKAILAEEDWNPCRKSHFQEANQSHAGKARRRSLDSGDEPPSRSK